MRTVEMFLNHAGGCQRCIHDAHPGDCSVPSVGHTQGADGHVCPNKVFAKVSRAEVAEPFAAAPGLVDQCVAEGGSVRSKRRWRRSSRWPKTSRLRRIGRTYRSSATGRFIADPVTASRQGDERRGLRAERNLYPSRLREVSVIPSRLMGFGYGCGLYFDRFREPILCGSGTSPLETNDFPGWNG